MSLRDRRPDKLQQSEEIAEQVSAFINSGGEIKTDDGIETKGGRPPKLGDLLAYEERQAIARSKQAKKAGDIFSASTKKVPMQKDEAIKKLRDYANSNGMRFKEYEPFKWAFFKSQTRVSATYTYQVWRDILVAGGVEQEIIK